MINIEDKSSDIGSTLIDLDFINLYPEYSARIEHDVITFYYCDMLEKQFARGKFSVEIDTEWTRDILLSWADNGETVFDLDMMGRFQ